MSSPTVVANSFTRKRALTLYRSILRQHRLKLPLMMRDIGDKYVRNEFKLHKNVNKLENLNQFFTAWDGYLSGLNRKAYDQRIGNHLRVNDVKALSPEQMHKLQELKHETEKIIKSD